jgi:hypothetical protein
MSLGLTPRCSAWASISSQTAWLSSNTTRCPMRSPRLSTARTPREPGGEGGGRRAAPKGRLRHTTRFQAARRLSVPNSHPHKRLILKYLVLGPWPSLGFYGPLAIRFRWLRHHLDPRPALRLTPNRRAMWGHSPPGAPWTPALAGRLRTLHPFSSSLTRRRAARVTARASTLPIAPTLTPRAPRVGARGSSASAARLYRYR